jgi:hypothetical protein
MKANLASGLHVALGQAVNVSAYDRWVGRWSPLFVPAVILPRRFWATTSGDRG